MIDPMDPAEFRTIRETLRLTKTALGVLLGMTYYGILRLEKGQRPINARTALAMRGLLLEHICQIDGGRWKDCTVRRRTI